MLITIKALTRSVVVTPSRPFARSKLKFPPDILRLLAFLTALIGFPLVANAVKINDTDSSVIYSTAGDEGTGPTCNTKERGIALTLRAVRKPAENRQCRVSTLAETFGAGKAVLIPVAYVQVPGARGGVVADLTATYSVEELINSVEIHEE